MVSRPNAQWYVRYDQSGNDGANGFDPTIPNAGTNYADRTSPILEINDATNSSIGSTTLTSSTGGFTADMVGNALAMFGGTNRNTADAWYWVMEFIDSNTIVVDHSLDNGAGTLSNGNARIGGARSAITSGSNAMGGNIVWIMGDGSDDPSTILYNVGQYLNIKSGNAATGHLVYRGYNGRPSIGSTSSLVLHSAVHASFENLKVVAGGIGWQSSHSMIHGQQTTVVKNCIIDQNGYDNFGVKSCHVESCWFRNTGGQSATNLYPAYEMTSAMYGQSIKNCLIENWNGPGIGCDEIGGECTMNIIRGCKSHGIRFSYNSTNRSSTVTHNTIVGNEGAGIFFTNQNEIAARPINNNVVAKNNGGGIRFDSANTVTSALINNNYYYDNGGSGNYVNMNSGVGDVILTNDPFVDSGNGNYNLSNTALKNAYQTEFLGLSGVTNYRSAGAVEHNDPTGTRTRHPLAR